MPVFLDTNVLLYSIGTNPADERKRLCAIALLDRTDCVLSVQVLQEFYVQATRAGRDDRLAHDLAIDLIRVWRRFPVVDNTVALLEDGLNIRKRTNFSLWDCLILAAAKFAQCAELYSEDLSDGRNVDGVRILNPFRD